MLIPSRGKSLEYEGQDYIMIEVLLYGELRSCAKQRMTTDQPVIQLSVREGETVGDLLHRLGIDSTLVGQVFLNRKLLSSRCSMAPWLGYQSAKERIPIGHSYLDAPVHSQHGSFFQTLVGSKKTTCPSQLRTLILLLNLLWFFSIVTLHPRGSTDRRGGVFRRRRVS